jgi:hypothetical protein
MKKLMILTSLLFLTSLSCPAEAAAQSCSSNPSACAPASSYTFGGAKAHSHNDVISEVGQYCGRWLVSDPTNNPGNNFYGNTICFDHWLFGPTWLYYDWSADPNAGTKISVWESTRPNILVWYDQTCLLASSASSSF